MVIKEFEEGRSFANLARQYSDDPQTRDNGGELGWFQQGQAVPEYEDAALALKPGQISAPVRSPYGLHIIRLEESEPARQKSFDEVKGEVRDLLVEEEAYRQLDKALLEVEDAIITRDNIEQVAAQ